MTIVEVRGYRVACRLAEAQGNATGFYDRRSSLLLELVDADGRSGWGEAWHAPEAAEALVRGGLAQVLLGQSPMEHARLWDAMAARLGYDRRGAGLMAVGALDMAVWDLGARQLGVPLATLLGGARRAHAFAYAAGPYLRPGGDPYRSYGEHAAGYVREGFRALKMKVGIDPAADAAAVAAVRAAVGEDVVILVDVNQGYGATAARALARRLAPLGVGWIEEPVGPFDLDGYRHVVAGSVVPVAGGEALVGARAFAAFLQTGVEIVQPDLSICGGFTEALRIAALADVAGRALVPHVWGTAVNALAALQWVAALPDTASGFGAPFPWFEYDRSPNPLREALPLPRPDADGRVPVPTGPGLGLDVHADAFSASIEAAWTVDSP